MSAYDFTLLAMLLFLSLIVFVVMPVWVLWKLIEVVPMRRSMRLTVATAAPTLAVGAFAFWLVPLLASDAAIAPGLADSLKFSVPFSAATAIASLGLCLAFEWFDKKPS
jgi:hypothetical protein